MSPAAQRPPPHDPDAERAILAGILLANAEYWEIADVLAPEHFFKDANRAVYEAISALAQRRAPIDLVTLVDELRRAGTLERAGGQNGLVALDLDVPATGRLDAYARIVRDAALRRRLIEAGRDIVLSAGEGGEPAEDLLDRAQQRVSDIADRNATGRVVSIADVIGPAFKTLEDLFERQNPVTGLATGMFKLDTMTTGLQPGDLIILAGRPSMGKTALGLQLAAYAAQSGPVVFFSQEQPTTQLLWRLMAGEARVDFGRLRCGKLLDSDFPKLAAACDRLEKLRLFLDDTAAVSPLEVRSRARRIKGREKGLRLVVVDYLQLMKTAKTESREQAIADLTRSLKAMARELEVPVLVLAQLNRSLEKREDKHPQLADLRESGAVEQDADLVLFVYRPEVYDTKDESLKGKAEIVIGKQRNGPTGTVDATFLGQFVRFENTADDRNEYAPTVLPPDPKPARLPRPAQRSILPDERGDDA